MTSAKLMQYMSCNCFVSKINKKYHSYSLASPEERKLMRAFAQINLSQLAVRSRGERSHLQQGSDSQISYLFFFLILISIVNSFCIFDDGI